MERSVAGGEDTEGLEHKRREGNRSDMEERRNLLEKDGLRTYGH